MWLVGPPEGPGYKWSLQTYYILAPVVLSRKVYFPGF